MGFGYLTEEAGPGMERTTGRSALSFFLFEGSFSTFCSQRTLEEATMGREKTAITIGKLIRPQTAMLSACHETEGLLVAVTAFSHLRPEMFQLKTAPV